MANIKSAEKRIRQNAKRTTLNRIVRGNSRTALKRARQSLANDAPESREDVFAAMRTLDKATSKGVLHKNNASRRKGRLMKALNGMEAAAEG